MESIREILSNLASQKGESTYKGIAATILTDYDLGIFRTQSELAKKCFVSESVITKFAQSLDFTGWKEFYYSLKSEYKKYYIQPSDNNKSNVLFDQFKLFNNLINNDTDFIEKISESILSKRKVVILPSYQLEDSCEFFYECLLELGIEAYFIKNRSLYPLMFKMDLRDFVVVVALSGQDNCF